MVKVHEKCFCQINNKAYKNISVLHFTYYVFLKAEA